MNLLHISCIKKTVDLTVSAQCSIVHQQPHTDDEYWQYKPYKNEYAA